MFEAPVNEVYVAKEGFKAVINGSVREFFAGDPITQQYLVDELIRGKCPIEKINTASDVCVCPNCGHKFI